MGAEFFDTPNGAVIYAAHCYFFLLDDDDGFRVEFQRLCRGLDVELGEAFPPWETWQLQWDPDSAELSELWAHQLANEVGSNFEKWSAALDVERSRFRAGKLIRDFSERWHLPAGGPVLLGGEQAVLVAWHSWRRTGVASTPSLGGGDGALLASSVVVQVEVGPGASLDAAIVDLRRNHAEAKKEFEAAWDQASNSSRALFGRVKGGGKWPGKEWNPGRIERAARLFFRKYYPLSGKQPSWGQLAHQHEFKQSNPKREVRFFQGLLQPLGVPRHEA